MGFLDRFRTRKRYRKVADQLYLASVKQSRSPSLYIELGVPDTVDGRFDMIILHVMLLIRRLRGGGEEAAIVNQEVLNLMFADMDRNFREMGIGDMSIGKHVKKTAKAFYGRAETLEKGLDTGPVDLNNALKETILRSIEAPDEKTSALAHYVVGIDRFLTTQSIENILSGEISFENTATADATA